MALRSAQKGCNTPRFLSLSSPVDFMMKTTDFTLPIRLVFRIFRLWIHAVIETAMLYEKCTAMALRSAQKRCNTPRFWSVHSPADFMMKITDFTVKNCVFYDPSALKKPASSGCVFTPAESTVENTQPALEPSE
ncbi:hypothetical protein T09_11911 [Trichinella sp. T9]|nr:hypothetical protein T09_11911 [Trichinella sp. T9]